MLRQVSGPMRSPQPVAVGAEFGGFRVRAITSVDAGRWIATEALAPEGDTVALWVSARTATADLGLSAHVEQLVRLRELREDPGLPVVAPVGAGRDLHTDRWFFALPSPTGDTLAHRLTERSLGHDEAVRLTRGIAAAVDALQAFGLPHAHLTPKGIVLVAGPPTRAVLHDYGTAPPTVRAVELASTLAVVDYLAPEVARGAALEAPGNVYALACILFEALTGFPPFPYDRPVLVLEAHRAEAPPRISDRADLPARLDRVLQDALDKEPARRQASAGDLVRATEAALKRTSSSIRVLQPVPRRAAAASAEPAAVRARPAARPFRRLTPTTAAVLATLLAATTAGFATGSTPRARAPETAAPSFSPRSAAGSEAGLRADHLRAAMDRLRADRVARRGDLGVVRSASDRAAAAGALADAYATARRALPPGPAGTGRHSALEAALRSTGLAYRRLATAARENDYAVFRVARADVLRHERAVERELARASDAAHA